ncbi:MAG: bifunctional riboflavin kinase/FAD synthetase [Alphaproteobacteria bacterium]|nr:bifunctional riboflavin kinase/FAD synthetase [Alphaproteobacteria bacterium]
MIVIRNWDAVQDDVRGGVFAIGNFDGVHRGHKALIKKVLEKARRTGAKSGVIVFEPHPKVYFHPHEPHFSLTPLDEKLRLLEGLGIEVAVVADFDAELASQPADEFIDNFLVGRLGVSHVVVGYDFSFGNRRSGSAVTLQAAGEKRGFGTTIIEQQAQEGEVFSSSVIREHLAQGDVAAAARLLGRWWRISGRVTSGAKLGTQLGFPTANVELPAGTALKHGIYSVRVLIGEEAFGGAGYFGGRPSVDCGGARLEVFIFNFSGDLYETVIGVEFIGYVRDDRRFDDLEEMKRQIAVDCDTAAVQLRKAGFDTRV